MNKLPPVQWLRSFEAAARHLSFTQAASELHVTQSSVSQQVKLLENHLGESLFIRRVRSLELSEAGRLYLPWVQQAFETLEQGTRMFTGKNHRKSVTVRANIAFITFWLAPRLAGFCQQHPDIQISLTTMIWQREYGLGEEDHVEIRFGKGDWQSEHIYALPSQVCFPVCTPEIASQLLNPADIFNFTRWETQGSADRWESWLSYAGYEAQGSQPVHSTSTFVVSMDMARRGLGIALGHPLVCADLLASGELVKPFDIDMPMEENYYLLSPTDNRGNASGRRFCDWVKTFFTTSDSN